MTNKELYDALVTGIASGKLSCRPLCDSSTDFIKCKVGIRTILIHNSVADIRPYILEKIDEEEFFNQSQIEKHFKRTHSFVAGLVQRGDFALVSIDGVKFYIAKDW